MLLSPHHLRVKIAVSFMIVVNEALFCLCRGTNIYNFWGCARISRHVPRLFILFNF